MAAQLVLPFRFAYLPLLVAACHTPHYPAIAGVSSVRLVILVGLLRAALAMPLRISPQGATYTLFIFWSIVAVLSGAFHSHEYNNPFVYRVGLVISAFGTFLYARAYLPEDRPITELAKGLACVLTPLAVFMAFEFITTQNIYHFLGARSATALVREGKIRAAGPFGTPILAGTVGAVCLPLMLTLWRSNRRTAVVGISACLLTILTSSSSTPIGSALIGIGALLVWRWRSKLSIIVWGSFVILIILHFIKERPIWYLIALVDFVGGSTGWHRSKLIDAGIQHFSEWWAWGTDYTVHWMPYALTTTPGHVDLTNHFLFLGVNGGALLVAIMVGILATSFRAISFSIRYATIDRQFTLWCAGATLFTHTITALTIAYFDNSAVFFYILIGAISIAHTHRPTANIEAEAPYWNPRYSSTSSASTQTNHESQ